MDGYKDKTDGSYIEEKESTIIWNYKNTDLDFGVMQAKELVHSLHNLFKHLPIYIMEHNSCV